jgi:hypothetical protein
MHQKTAAARIADERRFGNAARRGLFLAGSIFCTPCTTVSSETVWLGLLCAGQATRQSRVVALSLAETAAGVTSRVTSLWTFTTGSPVSGWCTCSACDRPP